MMDPLVSQHGEVQTEPQNKPDVMNDPAYDPIVRDKQSNLEEADSCRICRGEGSREEPLFYPCKCSGSIKYVHQNCLVEWLSHSQKKHCELCKTPFHFTKLYHPHMPSTVPLPIFFRQAAVHTWKSTVTSSRFLLVVFVWAAWLPWCMRTIWRGLFWIGDGAWANWTERKLQNETMALNISAPLATEGTSPVIQGLLGSKEASTSALMAQILDRLPRLIPPIRQTFNFATSEPWGLTLLRKIYYYITGGGPSPALSPASVTSNVTSHAGLVARSSWLSEIEVLRTLTPSTMVNNLIIDTLEGQLITLFVVVAFILIFLIREWVVQQQPVLNGGNDLLAEVAVAQNADAPVPPQPDDRIPELGGEDLAEAVDEGMQAPGRRARAIARARARRPGAPRRLPGQDGIPPDDLASVAAANGSEAERMDAESVGGIQLPGVNDDSSTRHSSELEPNQIQRPGMPDRDKLARAAEIRRTIEELSRVSDDPDSAIEVFGEFWARAGNQPLEVIRIIEREGRSNELGWIVAAMEKIDGLCQGATLAGADMSSTSISENPQSTSDSQPDDDAGFTLISPPSMNPSPEPQAAGNADPEAPGNSDPRLHAALPVASPRNESTEAATSSTYRTLGSVADNSPDADVDRASSTTIPRDQTAESSFVNPHLIDFDARPTPDEHVHDNPFHPDYEGQLPGASSNPLEQQSDSQTQAPPVQGAPAHARTIAERFSDWLWGGVAPLPAIPEQPAGDDEHVVGDIADEAPFVPIDRGQPLQLAANDRAVANQDPEVVAAAIQAGIDPNEIDAVEEIEDLEGILELIGMQGPLAGLIQNGMFCACLVSLTIIFGVWIPYVSGKVFLVLLAHPFSLLFRIPLRWAASTADTVIDVSTFCAGSAFFWTDTAIGFVCSPIAWLVPPLGRITHNKILAEASRSYAETALKRLAKTFVTAGDVLSETDIPMFSVTAHESLRSIEARVAWGFQVTSDQVAALFNTAYNSSSFREFAEISAYSISDHVKSLAEFIAEKTSATMTMWPSLLQISPLRINLSLPQRTVPIDYDLAHWNIKDRAIAIVFGYLFFALLGMLYLRLNSWMKVTNKPGRLADGVADGLYQSGGVMKVVLIIGIEMIVFPLYCGMLLDVALLPLFGNVTVMSRINFTLTSPTTSLFVHWFVGTCYMFHFALFVSMCRKILRSGVLYFIRDPDDPTFHPVRDVLERSVSTQLWKISFSALVYGGLVIVCLGGVVWGIAYTFAGVLPIQWSSNEPVLEFPVDLLFYNFLMPLAVKFFKPSKGLKQIYTWWFRRCARALRLTNFLFGDKKEDEEGRHVPRTWTFTTGRAESQGQSSDVVRASFIPEGRYVRAPGSDQVRIPKDARSFLEVDKDNNRVDGLPDPDDGLHGRNNELFTVVYVPPSFRIRISAFILLIWLFAAATGVSMTIVPLVFGRMIFAQLAPNHLRMNDVYAFSTGVYILGAALYGILHRHTMATYVRDTLTPHTTTIASFLRKFASLSIRFLSLVYTYTAFGILFPALLSLLMEFYLIIPLHTYFSTIFTPLDTIQSERHIIHLIQDWTLGVLYLKMAAQLILWNAPSRSATALRAIVRDGWLNPDARLATRGFIAPAVLVMSIALAAPLTLGWLANSTLLRAYSAEDEVFRACVYRYSYPGILAVGFAIALGWVLAKAFTGWRKKVRDEVYLIGERLHNYGEAKRRKGVGKGKGRAEAVA